jgi:nitroreductase
MELREAILTRRSVKKFDPSHEIGDEDLRTLVRFACLAPTSFNMQNWQFVAVRDKARKAELRAVSYNQAQVEEASLILLLCGRLDAHVDPSRVLRHAPDELRGMFTGMIQGMYGTNEDLNLQEACRSIAFAGQNAMLMARDMGLDSCPMIGFDPKKVSELLELPDTCPPLLMLTIGKALEEARPRMGLLDFEDVLSLEEYGRREFTGPLE